MEAHSAPYTEQKVMERRYHLPYNWLLSNSRRSWRQKNGLWSLAYELAGSLHGKRVLDVGCGDGWYSARMKEKGAVVSGADYSEKAVAFAQLIVPEVAFVHAPMQAMPYEDKTFDTVFSFQVIEHIPLDELEAGIRELRRVIRDDGSFVVTVPSVNRSRSAAHFQHFTVESLEKTLAPYFTLERAVGQERKTKMLRLISIFLENRYWILYKFSTTFNTKGYLNYYNRIPADRGQNIVALFKPAIVS